MRIYLRDQAALGVQNGWSITQSCLISVVQSFRPLGSRDSPREAFNKRAADQKARTSQLAD
jgi:hypothetical protein